jgi:hypothetical protein
MKMGKENSVNVFGSCTVPLSTVQGTGTGIDQ